MALVLRLVAVLLACAWAEDVDQACSEDADGTAPAKTCLMQARALGGAMEGLAVVEEQNGIPQHHYGGDEAKLNQEDGESHPRGSSQRLRLARLDQEGEEAKEGEDGAVAIHLEPSVTGAGPARDLKPLTDLACDLKTLTLNVLTGNRSEGGTNLAEFLEEQRLVNEAGAEVICETGFNFGASSLAFLCANPNTHVYSFDIGAHPYVRTAKDYLDSHFGAERLTLTIGDSTQTLPAAAEAGGVLQGKKCDVAFVDGGHTTPVALADIENFARLTKSGGLMLLENCNSQGRQRGWGGMNAVNAAYKEAVERGLVQHVAQVSTHCGEEESPYVCREICVSKFP